MGKRKKRYLKTKTKTLCLDQITQGSKVFTGIENQLQDQYNVALAQCSPMIELDKQYKKILELCNPMLEVQNRYGEILKQFNPMLEIPNSYERMIMEHSPALEVQKQYSTMLEQYKPMLDIQEQYKSLFKTDTYIVDMQKIAQEQISPIIEVQKQIYNQIKSVLDIYSNVDWDSMSRAAEEELREIDRKLIENEEEYWCLDIEVMTAMLNGEVTQDTLSEYIENNLEEYIEKITINPIYEIHSSLIQEAYEAFKVGLYKVCIMPLFAAFEHVIAFWFKGHITKEKVSVKSNPDVRRLYNKIDPDKYYAIDVEQYKKIFASSVLRTYRNTFVTGPKELGKTLNRNSIAHGFHDYNSLSKLDALKLFQLLKSTLVLRFVDSGNMAES
ncbi:hypothetical protein CON07_23355 [Bacillus sp. AFS094611]|uniref:hypothetical protein n=1 Tax=Bacillus sp. AFS094611 TaxID=2033516 RepID=UPI000BEB851F|nr:hypothetical protein [Bacillus sp. AFS094611]PDZ49172.1 hypothetical protein CON07_23355 [Bacillus sp. AFS094611]